MKLTYAQTAYMCRGLAMLLHSGVIISEGLLVLSQQEQGEFGKLTEDMAKDMDSGLALSAAIEKSNAFPEIVGGIIAMAESTGRLEQTLEYVADYYEERDRIIKQVKNSLTSPVIVMAIMLMVVYLLLTKVLPVFASVYSYIGVDMSGMAGMLLQTGKVLKSALPAIVLFALLALTVALAYRFNLKIKEKTDRICLKRYGDKGIAQNFNNAWFVGAVSMGMAAGFTPSEAVQIGSVILKHIPKAAQRCEKCGKKLAQGGNPVEEFYNAGFLTRAEAQMLSLGMKNGNGDKTMRTIADRKMNSANEQLVVKIGKIEPLLVLVSSVLVGLIILAVMLPLINIMTVIG